jgi:hypothetical protein
MLTILGVKTTHQLESKLQLLTKFQCPAIASLVLSFMLLCMQPVPVSAQETAVSGATQQITGRIQPGGDMDIYVLAGLPEGSVLYVHMRAQSGNLDPFVALVAGSEDLDALEARYAENVQQLISAGGNIGPGLSALRDSTFLAWDDDSGEGYAAALQYTVEKGGDLQLIVAGAQSNLGRATQGEYALTLGIDAPEVLTGAVSTGSAQIAVINRSFRDLPEQVTETKGEVSVNQPPAVLDLVDFSAGGTLQVFVEATSGSLRPVVLVRDFGGKPLAAANMDGQSTSVAFDQLLEEAGSGYTVEIYGAEAADGTPTTGEFRALVGINAPDVLQGRASADAPSLRSPTPVQVGIIVDRISEVDSTGETFTVIGSIRLDWQDAALAFSPDTCNCDVKVYTAKEFDQFLAKTRSLWPDFTFFNQKGNRFTQNRAAAVWPDGSARYLERFSTTFQADFNFRLYPFDVQEFPIVVDMVLPGNLYELVPLGAFSRLNPEHGEDEFILGELTSTQSTIEDGAAADSQTSRMTFAFVGPRHLNYYYLQIFVPILLIILISWFTFFLKDYGQRVEAAAANVLLFIAFSFSLAGNYPRLGYITFLDAIMGVTFVVNTLVLLYNVLLKRMEVKGETARIERIDRFFDWAYPLSYLLLVGFVVLLFFGPR